MDTPDNLTASSEESSALPRSVTKTDRLTWVNYIDPQRDRKRKQNRAAVRKAAKLSTLPSPTTTTLESIPTNSAQTTSITTTSSAKESFDTPELITLSTRDASSRSSSPMMRSGNSDPFDSLPIHTDNRSFSFLNRYLQSVHIRPECMTSCPKTLELRRQYLLPTLVRSRGTLHVALLYLEREWKLSNPLQHTNFQAHHQMGAITELQKTLQNQNSLIPIETFLMIGKLATAASYAGDHSAVEAHYGGMAQLFIRHWGDLASHPVFVLGVFVFWSARSVSTRCCINKTKARAQQTSCSLIWSDDNAELTQKGEKAFARLRYCGLISQATLDIIPAILKLSQLIYDARVGMLTMTTAKELLRLKWHCSARFQSLEAMASQSQIHEFERALWLTLQLALTLCINCSLQCVADYYCPVIGEHLSKMDLTPILESSPEALLWVLLVAGSCSAKDQTPFFAMLLRLWADSMRMVEYKSFLLHAKQFVWTSQLDDKAAQFWHNAMRPGKSMFAPQIDNDSDS